MMTSASGIFQFNGETDIQIKNLKVEEIVYVTRKKDLMTKPSAYEGL